MVRIALDALIGRVGGTALVLAVFCAFGAPCSGIAETERTWTIYVAQDKHLDYNWCGTTTEIELRMATLLDFYLDQAEQKRGRWNLDGTLWADVYRRHRGDMGLMRLYRAIRAGDIGFGGNHSVLLWGILDTETAIRASYGAVPIERATGQSAHTALVMENPSMTWGIANVLSECGFDHLGRGIYSLPAESYIHDREPYPLFWWKAPNGKRLLVHWDLYHSTRAWGGYAEAFRLAELGGVRPTPRQLQRIDDRNTPEVFQKRKQYIEQTVKRYEAHGDAYPISSILLLGTGHDGWVCSDGLSRFIERFNADSDGRIRLVDLPSAVTCRRLNCRRGPAGVYVIAEFERHGFKVTSRWLFHADRPWIDVAYRLRDGWTDEPQTVQFAFPLTMDKPTYRYDAPGAVLVAGPKSDGGDELPGANPELFAGLTFASATSEDRVAGVVDPGSTLFDAHCTGSDAHQRRVGLRKDCAVGNDGQSARFPGDRRPALCGDAFV